MNQEEIKEYILKMEGFAEGLKFGVNQSFNWMIKKLQEAEQLKQEVKL